MAIELDQRTFARRSSDEWRVWAPLIIYVVTTLLTVGVMYGRLDGRLQLIEFRLHRIEIVLKLEQ